MTNIFQDTLNIPHTDALQPTSPQEFRKIVENRRSIRVYEDTPIPESVVRDCLDLTLLAPNSSNLQPWEFYWVRSQEKKQKLVEYCFSQNAAKTAPELFVAVARIDRINYVRKELLKIMSADGSLPKSVRQYYEVLVPFAYKIWPLSLFAPIKWLIYTVTGFFRIVPREPLGKSDLQLWASKTTALACENLMLAFSAHGYDTCPMEGLDSYRVKKLLDLPRSSIVVMAISAGKRKPSGVYGKRVRLPKEEFLKEV